MLMIFLLTLCFVVLLIIAMSFVLPSLWVTPEGNALSRKSKVNISILLATIMLGFALIGYWQLGSGTGLLAYYHEDFITQREHYAQMRPMIVDIKRTLIKYRVQIALDPNDVNTLERLGKLYEIVQEDQLALDAYQKILDIDPDRQEIKSRMDMLKQT